MNLRREFYKSSTEEISQSINIGDYQKYVIDDEDDLILAKRCPVSVQAIARYNYLAHQNNRDDLKIYTGKIKYYNISLGGKRTGYFGFPSGELPEWAPPVDSNKAESPGNPQVLFSLNTNQKPGAWGKV